MVTVKPLFMEGKGERREELFLELVTSDCLFKNSISSVSVPTVCVCVCACVCVFMCAYIYMYIDGFPPQVLLRYN